MRAAINASGTAAAVFVTGTKLLAATRTATTDWPATPETVEGALPVSNNAPAVGIDSAGNVLAAFTYGTPPTRILRTARRPVAGGWLPSSDLSANVNASADYLNLAVSPSGPAALVWSQSTAAVASVKALYGTSATGVWGQTEDVSASATTTPVAAIADDGSVVATWEHFTAGGSLEEASVRSAGAAGVWSAIRPLSAVHANGVIPSLSGDGLGDFATLGTPYDGTYHPVLLSFYDAAPPVLAPVTFTGASFAGLPVTMSTTTSDAWSAVAAPVWTFGDGFTATGLKVTHSYDFGSYLGNVSVTDAAGNSARSELIATAVSAEAFVLRAAFHPTWKRSRVSGTLTISGTVPVAGTYAITIAKHGRPESKVLASLALAPGPFARSIKLPATFLPGTTPLPGLYDVLLRARSAFVRRGRSRRQARGSPRGRRRRRGAQPHARRARQRRTLTGANAVWARFHFAAIPKGKKLTRDVVPHGQGQAREAEDGNQAAARHRQGLARSARHARDDHGRADARRQGDLRDDRAGCGRAKRGPAKPLPATVLCSWRTSSNRRSASRWRAVSGSRTCATRRRSRPTSAGSRRRSTAAMPR